MDKNKLVIIFVILLSSFVVGGGCYFLLRNKSKKVDFFKEKEKDVLEIAKKDVLLFRQQLDDYKQKVTDEKQVHQEDLEKSIETLKEQGIWEGEDLGFEKSYKEYLDVIHETGTFQLQLDELLEKVEKEKDLASFREELEKLSEKSKKDIDAFVDLKQRIQEEAKKPMPFLATWIGLISIIIIFVISGYVIFTKFLRSCCLKEIGICGFFAIGVSFYVFYFLLLNFFIFANYLLASKKDYKDKIYFSNEVGKFIVNNASKNTVFDLMNFVVPCISALITLFSHGSKMKKKHVTYVFDNNGNAFEIETEI